jgi:hypothetical protein
MDLQSLLANPNLKAALQAVDTLLVFDDSSSMDHYWSKMREALSMVSTVCTKHDDDGVDVYFFNHQSVRQAPDGKAPGGYYGLKTAKDVDLVFTAAQPWGMTPTGATLQRILDPYITQYGKMDRLKPLNVIVLTDGDATDTTLLRATRLRQHTRRGSRTSKSAWHPVHPNWQRFRGNQAFEAA